MNMEVIFAQAKAAVAEMGITSVDELLDAYKLLLKEQGVTTPDQFFDMMTTLLDDPKLGAVPPSDEVVQHSDALGSIPCGNCGRDDMNEDGVHVC